MSLSPKPTEVLSVTPPLDSEAIPEGIASKKAQPREKTLSHRSSVGVAAIGGHRLTRETDELRRERLRAAAGFFVVAVALFLAWRLTIPSERYLWPLNVCMMLVLTAMIALLSDRGPQPPWLLRTVEVAV